MSEQNRIALVIGNSNYPKNPLPNCAKDAREMSVVLSRLGFRVSEHTDLTYAAMRDAFQAFINRLGLENADVCLFYYSGHGCSIDGMIGLGPVGENEPPFPLDSFLSALPENIVKILILDTCRIDYYGGNTEIKHIFTVNPEYKHPKNTFMAFATGLFSPAFSGRSPWTLGFFTNEVLKWIERPGMEIEAIFKEVRKSMHRLTDGAQIPWTNSSLIQPFYFVPPDKKPDDHPYNPLKSAAFQMPSSSDWEFSRKNPAAPSASETPEDPEKLYERIKYDRFICKTCHTEISLHACGSNWEPSSDSFIAKCPYCRGTVTVPYRADKRN